MKDHSRESIIVRQQESCTYPVLREKTGITVHVVVKMVLLPLGKLHGYLVQIQRLQSDIKTFFLDVVDLCEQNAG